MPASCKGPEFESRRDHPSFLTQKYFYNGFLCESKYNEYMLGYSVTPNRRTRVAQ